MILAIITEGRNNNKFTISKALQPSTRLHSSKQQPSHHPNPPLVPYEVKQIEQTDGERFILMNCWRVVVDMQLHHSHQGCGEKIREKDISTSWCRCGWCLYVLSQFEKMRRFWWLKNPQKRRHYYLAGSSAVGFCQCPFSLAPRCHLSLCIVRDHETWMSFHSICKFQPFFWQRNEQIMYDSG